MTQTQKRRGLGRGLDALFQDVEAPQPQGAQSETATDVKNTLPIVDLKPGKYQPRTHFNEDAIADLASSIKQHGILQPILVRPLSKGQGYEIIAGERRWRAAQKAQLHDVPVIIQDLSDDVALEIALIENLQREDLTPIEEAEGYKRLIEEFEYTQEQLSKKLGKSRSQVTNTLRLLKLPAKVKTYVQKGKLSAGHARALLSAEDPVALAAKVMNEGLSVRETEKLALSMGTDLGNDHKSNAKRESQFKKDVDTTHLEKELSAHIGMRVVIDPSADGSGRISIQYKTLDQLDGLIEKLSN